MNKRNYTIIALILVFALIGTLWAAKTSKATLHEQFLERSYGGLPNPLLLEAVTLMPRSGTFKAIDLGFGAGNEVKYLLEQGAEVTALDGDSVAIALLLSRDNLAHTERLHFVQGQLESYDLTRLGQYDLVSAFNVLPFIGRDLPDIWCDIVALVKTGGVFVFNLYGPQLKWPKRSGLYMIDSGTLEDWLVGFDVKVFNEAVDVGYIKGEKVVTHQFQVLAIRNAHPSSCAFRR